MEERRRREKQIEKISRREKQKKNDYLDTLSMGMSSDFVTAIENGANMLRIGQEIFGKRT